MKFIIMAGGQGTKLWPLSKDSFPKQFSDIVGNRSLFQLNLDDLLSEYSPEDIFISTTEAYINYVKEQAPMVPSKNIIIEPHLKRNTGPASCYAMAHLLKEFPDEVVGFYVQPVVIREPREKYIEMLKGMEFLVGKYGQLVTGGKVPTHPEVGSDYIKLGEELNDVEHLEIHTNNKYVERPSTIEQATQMLNDMKLAVHCNHYTWTPRKFFDSLKIHMPNWYDVSMEIAELIGTENFEENIKEKYSKYETGKVEYFTQKIYENEGVQVVILPFNWIHITTWNDVFEYLKQNGHGTIHGKVVQAESSGNIVLNQSNRVISLLDVNDFAIIQTDEVTLICPQNKSAQMHKILEEMEKAGYKDIL